MKNRKAEPRFKLSRHGYDRTAVEEYISAETKKAERVQSEQRERIITLNSQVDLLKAQLNQYKSREEQITATLVAATEKAEGMTADIRFRYGLELDRLNNFRAKWTGAYSELKERYNFGKDALNMESVAISAKLELERFLAQDFSIQREGELSAPERQFKSEADRLSRTESGVEELREKLLKASEKKGKADCSAAFSLEEATHPTESLAELCEYLGLKKQA